MTRNTNKTVIYSAFHANVNRLMKMETKVSYIKNVIMENANMEREKVEIVKYTQFIKLKTE